MTLMRHLSRLSVAAAVAAALVPSAAAGAASRTRCPDRPGTTLALDNGLRVYQTIVKRKANTDGTNLRHKTVRLFSCIGLQRKARLLERFLDSPDDRHGVTRTVVGGGRWIAINSGESTLGGQSDDRVVEYDATTGKSVATIATDSGIAFGFHSFFGGLVISSSGSLLYQSPYGLTVVDKDGLRVLVKDDGKGDSAPTASDFAISGTQVHWTVTKTGAINSAVAEGHPKGSIASGAPVTP